VYSCEHGEGAQALARVLEAAEAVSPVEAAESVTSELGMALGATAVSFLIADLSGRALVRLAHIDVNDVQVARADVARGERREGEESATEVPFDGGPAEQVVRTQQPAVLAPVQRHAAAASASSWRVLAPVTERGEVIGLLEFLVPEEPSAQVVAEMSRLAHVLAFVVIANRRHTDLYEWGQRTRPLTLSAEIQHRLLPGPQTCEAGEFTLAGWLEPSAAIAGDTFDFSLARDALHLSITDAMGHGVEAALNATLCVGSLRNARNTGATLLEQTTITNRALAAHALHSDLEDFVTGLIGRLDLRTGTLELVNAGHVAPYLVGRGLVAPVELPVDLPLGLFPETAYRSTLHTLEPRDRLVLVTDGMLERNAGVDLRAAIQDTASLHPREATRALADRILEATGHRLKDDATILCLDWHGGHASDRNTKHGADLAPGTEPIP
jgi:serine phosphatase RsbU (regulator of sigma subunit)